MSSLVKWVGGKGWLTPFIKPVVVKLIKDTGVTSSYEPFAGGLSVFEVLQGCTNNNYIGDVNSSLMSFYEMVAEQPEDLYEVTTTLFKTAGNYYEQRELFNNCHSYTIAQAARFWYLTLHSYRGLWRVNSSGAFNTPDGNYKSAKLPDWSDVLNWSVMLKSTVMFAADYQVTLHSVNANSFVYLDPPYYGQFGNYDKSHFNYDEFIEFVKALPCRWVMSNTNNPKLRSYFKDKRLLTLTKPGGFENKPIKELLIVNA